MDESVPVWTDSTVAKAIATAPYVTKRARMYKVAYHRVREEVQAKTVKIDHVAGTENLADVMTKSTTKAVLDYSTENAMIQTDWPGV